MLPGAAIAMLNLAQGSREMGQASLVPMTADEFLAWEADQEFKWEFDGCQPVAMAGGTDEHAAIQANLLAALVPRLRGTPCRVRGSEVKIKAGSSYRYPDAFVRCTPVERGATVTDEPVVIFEIMSPSTERKDRTIKLREYRAIPSMRRYVLLEQDGAVATTYARTDTGWIVDQFDGDGILDMPEIGISVPMAELYDGLTFLGTA